MVFGNQLQLKLKSKKQVLVDEQNLLNDKFRDIVTKAQKIIFKDNNIVAVNIQPMYMTFEEIVTEKDGKNEITYVWLKDGEVE